MSIQDLGNALTHKDSLHSFILEGELVRNWASFRLSSRELKKQWQHQHIIDNTNIPLITSWRFFSLGLSLRRTSSPRTDWSDGSSGSTSRSESASCRARITSWLLLTPSTLWLGLSTLLCTQTVSVKVSDGYLSTSLTSYQKFKEKGRKLQTPKVNEKQKKKKMVRMNFSFLPLKYSHPSIKVNVSTQLCFLIDFDENTFTSLVKIWL